MAQALYQALGAGRTGRTRYCGRFGKKISVSALLVDNTTSSINPSLAASLYLTGYSPGGTVTSLSFVYSAIGSSSFSDLLVKVIDLAYSGIGTVATATTKFYNDVFNYNGVGSVAISKQIGKFFSASAIGSFVKQRQVGLFRAFSAVGTSLYADTVSFGRTLLHTGLGVLAMTKSFIGGGGGTVSTLIRRGKFIMNKFGRW